VPARILELTDGNPYLIKVICYQLVEHLWREGRSNITGQDLDQVLKLVIHDGRRYFDHFAGSLRGMRTLVLSVIAGRSTPQDWVAISDVIEAIQGRLGGNLRRPVREAVEALTRQGVLEWGDRPDGELVHISVSLFHIWAQEYLDFESALEAYRALGSPTRPLPKG
jgi:hypothetical protein